MDQLRHHYERHPYPPISVLAVPRSEQRIDISYEGGTRIAFGEASSHAGKRILVVGAGTFEALVVAQTHPKAEDIVALDFSRRSLHILKQRVALVRATNLLRPIGKRRLARISYAEDDLDSWCTETARIGRNFDYIIASNVLHHTADPARSLERISACLRPQGIMRVITYPKTSRIWMRETKKWFLLNHVRTKDDARRAIKLLPELHPVRLTFDTHPEKNKSAGFADAFLNPLENPLSPFEWRSAFERCGLRVTAEFQQESSRSTFLDWLLPQTHGLEFWEKLQILDDLLELCANPSFWIVKDSETKILNSKETLSTACSRNWCWPKIDQAVNRKYRVRIPSRVQCELGEALRRANALLSENGLSVKDAIKALREKVGPRISASPEERHLPGLSIIDFNEDELLKLPPASALTIQQPLSGHFLYKGERVPGQTATDQLLWLQTRYGPEQTWIDVDFLSGR